MNDKVSATAAALAAIESLTAKHGKLMFVQSGGCCDGSSPICFRDGEFITGPHDLLLGTIGNADFYIDSDQYERWNTPAFVIDVAPGPPEGFSIGPDELHFVARSAAGAPAPRIA